MERKPHVLRGPLLILVTFALVLALIAAVGLPLWAAREQTVSAIPEHGTYTCEELSITLTFGDRTTLTLPEGYIEITFDALPIPFEPDRVYRFTEITN